jgi:hypothetical protein
VIAGGIAGQHLPREEDAAFGGQRHEAAGLALEMGGARGFADQAEAEVGVADALADAAARVHRQVGGAARPRAARDAAVLLHRVGEAEDPLAAGEFVFVADHLPDVAGHVVEAPGVRLVGFHGLQVLLPGAEVAVAGVGEVGFARGIGVAPDVLEAVAAGLGGVFVLGGQRRR